MTKLCFEKFKRGQIWVVKKDKDESIRGMRDKHNHIIEKSRPWLIVSNNISNTNSPILNCVPITSRLAQYLPCHVSVNMEKGLCDIQCEQITTLNKSDFKDATFIGEINEDIMQKIEIALANQLGLSIQVPSLETLQVFIEKLANAKAEEMKLLNSQATDNYVSSIVEKLESIFSIPNTNTVSVENSANSIKSDDSIITEENKDLNLDKSKNKSKQAGSKTSTSATNKSNRPSTYRKWTKESMMEFMEDTEKLSAEEICKKYNMSLKSIYNTKYRLKINLKHLMEKEKND